MWKEEVELMKKMLLKSDIDYLGCRNIVNNASPVINPESLRTYYHYMCERNKVYQRKELSKQNPPWTNDEIIKNNSFTCVKRYLDRTSKWLTDNISNNSDLSYEDRVWRTILFRLYNKIETAELIRINMYEMFWSDSQIRDNMDKLDATKNDPFTRAYKVIRPKYAYRDISPKGHDNWKSSLYWYITQLRIKYNMRVPNDLEKDAISAITWIKSNIDGVGDFIAYQIWCDLCYINEYPMSTNFYTIAGPGCIAGIDMLVDDLDGMNHNEFLFWLRDNIDKIFKEYDSTYDIDNFFWYLDKSERYWDLQDLENSFCEFSKYCYVRDGRHKKPRKYIYHN